MQRVLPLVVAGLTAVAVVAPAAQAAAPRIVVVSGKPMAHQIAISNWARSSGSSSRWRARRT
jgi:hypothetical protein